MSSTWASAWMLVLTSPLATWEMTKLMVEAVLLWRSSKCGETARILGAQDKAKVKVKAFPLQTTRGASRWVGVVSLGLWDHDGLQQLVQLVLDQVRQLTHSALVHLDHVQVQLELLWDGRVVGLVELSVLTSLTGGMERQCRRDWRSEGCSLTPETQTARRLKPN